MKKILMLAVLMLILMPGTAGAEIKNWAENWFELTPTEKTLIVSGYRLGVNFVCERDNGVNRSKLYCIGSRASDGQYAIVPEFLNTIYRNKNYKYIQIDLLIHLILMYVTKAIDVDQLDNSLNILAAISEEEGVTDKGNRLKMYEDTVKSLVQ